MKKKLFIIFCFSFLLAIKFPQGVHSLEYEGISYSLFVPRFPRRIMVALHAPQENTKKQIDFWKTVAEKNGYVVLAPEALDKNGWIEDDQLRIKEIISMTIRDYKIQDVLLCGASTAGNYALFYGLKYDLYFKGVVTFGGVLEQKQRQNMGYAWRQSKPELLLIHGHKDNLNSMREARNNAVFLSNLGYKVSFWEEPKMNHKAYAPLRQEVIDWFEAVILRSETPSASIQ